MGRALPGPISRWSGNGNANDSQNTNHGTLEKGTTFAAGKYGQAFSFDGVDDYVNVPDSPSLDALTSTATVEAWINPQVQSGGENGWVFGRRNPLQFEGLSLAVMNDGGVLAVVGTTTSPTANGSNFLSAPGTIQFDGKWKHIALAINTNTGSVKAYLNGQPIALAIESGPAVISGELKNLDNLFIGRRQDPATTEGIFGASQYKGLIDELAVYSSELTQSQVQEIYNGQPLPSLSISNPRAFPEGSAGAPGSTTFGIRLSAPSAQTVTVNYQTANGLVNGAVAGQDYVATSGTVTFAPGRTLKTVTVPFIGDSIAELNETFFLDLRTPTNATIASSRGKAFIGNDDGPSIVIDNAVSVQEGNSGTRAQNFTVRLSAASTNTVTVNWATSFGPQGSGAGPSDFTVANGTLSFAPGETTKTITIQVKGDTAVEPNEKYFVNLTRPTFAIIADSQGSGFILNDDFASGLAAGEQPS